MSRVWICEEITAEHPLFLEEERMNLYSFEELCCYLYQNTGVLEESFFHEKLCQWLEQEIGKQELSQILREGIRQERSGCWCMEQILKDGGFYNSEELQLVLNTAKSMEQKSPMERAKLRGDRLLKSEKYRDAIWEYRKIIARARQEPEGGKVIGLLWHNMGTAYARQMLFEQAAKCYETAYEIGQKPESKEAYLLALACRDGQDIPNGTDSTAKIRQELKEKRHSPDHVSYEKLLEATLQNLRTEYRKSE